MGKSEEAAAIQQEMARIRSDLHSDVAGLVENVRVMTDWRHYVRRYPWACVGGAALIGYMLTPRRVEIVSPDAATIAKLAARNQLVVQQKAKAEPKSSLAASAMSMVASLALRAALAYASQQAGKLVGVGAAQATSAASGQDDYAYHTAAAHHPTDYTSVEQQG